MSVVPSSRWKTSICVTSTASTNSPSTALFITLLSKVSVVSTVPDSLRHSRAATMRRVHHPDQAGHPQLGDVPEQVAVRIESGRVDVPGGGGHHPLAPAF